MDSTRQAFGTTIWKNVYWHEALALLEAFCFSAWKLVTTTPPLLKSKQIDWIPWTGTSMFITSRLASLA